LGYTATGGPQITSTTAIRDGDKLPLTFNATDLGGTSFDGVPFTEPNTVVVKYDYANDVNFDFFMNYLDVGTELGLLSNSQVVPAFGDPGYDFQNSLFAGDLNSDGFANYLDVGIVLGALSNQSLNPLSTGGLEGLGGSASVTASLSASAVPEPATLFLLGLGSAGMLLRRKRRNS